MNHLYHAGDSQTRRYIGRSDSHELHVLRERGSSAASSGVHSARGLNGRGGCPPIVAADFFKCQSEGVERADEQAGEYSISADSCHGHVSDAREQ